MNAAIAPPTRTAAASQARPPQGHGRRARRALAPRALAIVVLTGQATASLAAAIVNVAGPAIQRDVPLSGPALQLAVYSYLLAACCSPPPSTSSTPCTKARSPPGSPSAHTPPASPPRPSPGHGSPPGG